MITGNCETVNSRLTFNKITDNFELSLLTESSPEENLELKFFSRKFLKSILVSKYFRVLNNMPNVETYEEDHGSNGLLYTFLQPRNI